MHKNELFFRPSVFGYPARTPPKFTPSHIPPLEVGPLAIPGSLVVLELAVAHNQWVSGQQYDTQSVFESIHDSVHT